jgi:hypothetical protein
MPLFAENVTILPGTDDKLCLIVDLFKLLQDKFNGFPSERVRNVGHNQNREKVTTILGISTIPHRHIRKIG